MILKYNDPSTWSELIHSAKGNLVFDIGANWGETSRIFSNNFKAIISLEPAIESYSELIKHLPVNCIPLNMAAYDVIGRVDLCIDDEWIKTGQLILGPPEIPIERRRPVAAITLDKLSTLYGVPDLIKIDVEGCEYKVIKGAASLLASRYPKWIIEIHSTELGNQVKQVFLDHNYFIDLIRHPGHSPGSTYYDFHYMIYCYSQDNYED
jgi:FkbM family methyltransferase